jgi:hypothetical protein
MLKQDVEEGHNYSTNKPGERVLQRCVQKPANKPTKCWGEIHEKLLVNTIMHFLYSKDLLNQDPFGFIPLKSTTDATMSVKDFLDEALPKGKF